MNTALESAVQSFWRNSQAALAGSDIAARRLEIASEMYRGDVERIAHAASNTLGVVKGRNER